MGAAGQAEKQAMESALRSMLTEPGWRHLLDLRSHPGHRYSLGNIAWLCAQAEQRGMPLSEVRGFRAWEAVGRNVRRGEKALRVLAPITAKVQPKPDDPAQTTGSAPQVRVVGWRTVAVFDVSQTDGPPLPEATDRLDAADPTDLAGKIRECLSERGWEVRTVPRDEVGLGAHGVTRPHPREVVVADDLSPAQAAAVLAHELAHTLLPDLDEPASELAAEAFSYLVCRRAGLDVSEIAFPYLAAFAPGGTPDDVVKQVTSAADLAAKLADQVVIDLGLAEPEPPAPEHTPPQHRRTRRAVREREAVPAWPTYSPPAVATTGPGLSA